MFYKIIIIDYGLGNIRSAQKSIQATLKKNNFNGTVEISSDKKKLSDATHIILPGQGSFEHCINGLKSLDRTFNLLNQLGNPQNNLENVISIVGAKSKASMAYSLQSILKQNGYKSNLYTSPHLTSYTERFIYNDK